MDMNKPMPLLLIEDDPNECLEYKECMRSRSDVKLIGMTGSSTEGVKYVKTHVPEGVILDLELHKGSGSGLSFLSAIKSEDISFRPLIFVVTGSSSEVVYDYAHAGGADLVFSKKQNGYSPEIVINTFLTLRPSLHGRKRKGLSDGFITIETVEEHRRRLKERINRELDLIGVGRHLAGRKYIFDAIFYLVQQNLDQTSRISVFDNVCKNNKKTLSAISRGIQTAINTAWRTSSTEDLKTHYTARINYDTGVPSPTEFVYHYANKLRENL